MALCWYLWVDCGLYLDCDLFTDHFSFVCRFFLVWWTSMQRMCLVRWYAGMTALYGGTTTVLSRHNTLAYQNGHLHNFVENRPSVSAVFIYHVTNMCCTCKWNNFIWFVIFHCNVTASIWHGMWWIHDNKLCNAMRRNVLYDMWWT